MKRCSASLLIRNAGRTLSLCLSPVTLAKIRALNNTALAGTARNRRPPTSPWECQPAASVEGSLAIPTKPEKAHSLTRQSHFRDLIPKLCLHTHNRRSATPGALLVGATLNASRGVGPKRPAYIHAVSCCVPFPRPSPGLAT